MASLPKISPQEYLIRDRINFYKSEYCLGQMYAMAGASDRHNTINENITSAMLPKLREKGCRSASSDQRVYAPLEPFFAYPDKVITCGPKVFLPDENKDTLINPVAVFEVLSESTREYDLGLKFTMYSTITSLREYMAVEQDSVLVHHWHKDSGEWIKEEHTAGVMHLFFVGITLNIDDLYMDVSF